MTEKTVITEEQVVSRKGGYISYYDAGSTLRKAKTANVTVLPAGSKLPEKEDATASPSPVAEAPADMATAAKEEVAVEASNDAPVTVSSPPVSEKPTKPSKRGNKTKETADMATKSAAKKKAPAKKASAPKPGGKGVRTIGGKPVDISRYTKAKAPGGGTSFNNGDAVAQKLEGKNLDEVYNIVAKALKVEEKELRSKYKVLNVGMQRMNLGNRLRKAMAAKADK